jgi:hypothetical protein
MREYKDAKYAKWRGRKTLNETRTTIDEAKIARHKILKIISDTTNFGFFNNAKEKEEGRP